jgi:micrococcal nuclease
VHVPLRSDLSALLARPPRSAPRRLAVAAGLALVAALLLWVSAQRSPVYEVLGPVPVEEVVDGDTIVLRSDLGPRVVRLIGIDTPEVAHPEKGREPFGPQASAYTARLLPRGTPVWVELDLEIEDAYGRLLAYVYRPDPDGRWRVEGRPASMVNLEIARAGMARVLSIAPNRLYQDLFEAAVAEARAEGRGLFGDAPDAVVPPDEQRDVAGGAAAPPERAPEGGALRIHCVLYDPATNEDEAGEWVEVQVREPIDTRGHYLHDEGSGARFPLPSGPQQPGTIRIENPGAAAWNNGGDTIYLKRGDEVVDAWTYPDAAEDGEVVCRDGTVHRP